MLTILDDFVQPSSDLLGLRACAIPANHLTGLAQLSPLWYLDWLLILPVFSPSLAAKRSRKKYGYVQRKYYSHGRRYRPRGADYRSRSRRRVSGETTAAYLSGAPHCLRGL